jgi:hypothetical protein
MISFMFSIVSYLFNIAEFHPFIFLKKMLSVNLMVFQYDMWNVTPTNLHDWSALKAKVATHGIRNSLLLAPMPTASTAQILGNNEGIEAYTSNIYTRRVLSGEFQVNHLFFKDHCRLDILKMQQD